MITKNEANPLSEENVYDRIPRVKKDGEVAGCIRQLQTVMKDWQDTLKNNSTDGEDYSRGLLKGYEAAIRQVDNWLGEYYA